MAFQQILLDKMRDFPTLDSGEGRFQSRNLSLGRTPRIRDLQHDNVNHFGFQVSFSAGVSAVKGFDERNKRGIENWNECPSRTRFAGQKVNVEKIVVAW
jgi:hypothetical protein